MSDDKGRLEPHAFAAMLPMMSPAELDALADDVAAHGLRQPIVLYKGKVLDGRNRLLACEKAGVEPRFTEHEGDDASALALVISLNAQRRDLTAGQRAIVAARAMEQMPERRGGDRTKQSGKSSHNGVKSREQVAAQFKVSDKSVQQAKALFAEAPDLAEQVASCAVSLADAYGQLQGRREAAQRAASAPLADDGDSVAGASADVGGPPEARENRPEAAGRSELAEFGDQKKDDHKEKPNVSDTQMTMQITDALLFEAAAPGGDPPEWRPAGASVTHRPDGVTVELRFELGAEALRALDRKEEMFLKGFRAELQGLLLPEGGAGASGAASAAQRAAGHNITRRETEQALRDAYRERLALEREPPPDAGGRLVELNKQISVLERDLRAVEAKWVQAESRAAYMTKVAESEAKRAAAEFAVGLEGQLAEEYRRRLAWLQSLTAIRMGPELNELVAVDITRRGAEDALVLAASSEAMKAIMRLAGRTGGVDPANIEGACRQVDEAEGRLAGADLSAELSPPRGVARRAPEPPPAPELHPPVVAAAPPGGAPPPGSWFPAAPRGT